MHPAILIIEYEVDAMHFGIADTNAIHIFFVAKTVTLCLGT